jgi:hypothetical protein
MENRMIKLSGEPFLMPAIEDFALVYYASESDIKLL